MVNKKKPNRKWWNWLDRSVCVHSKKPRRKRNNNGSNSNVKTVAETIPRLRPGTLIATPGDRDDIILAAISSAKLSDDRSIAGIILTNDIPPHEKLLELLAQTDIPVIAAKEESYTITSKITSMTVKTQPQDTDKIPVIKSLLTEHIDMKRLLSAF